MKDLDNAVSFEDGLLVEDLGGTTDLPGEHARKTVVNRETRPLEHGVPDVSPEESQDEDVVEIGPEF